MIHVTCPHCGSKLNARKDLTGEMRKCPKCAQPFVVVPDPPPASAEVALAPPTDAPPAKPATDEALPSLDLPEHLNRDSHYLICDRTHLVATWQNDGRGWMLKTSSRLIPAKRNREKLPAEGDFKLVELKLKTTPNGKCLVGLTSYQLAPALGPDRARPKRRSDYWQDRWSWLVEPGPEERRAPDAGRSVHARRLAGGYRRARLSGQHRLSLVRRGIVREQGPGIRD